MVPFDGSVQWFRSAVPFGGSVRWFRSVAPFDGSVRWLRSVVPYGGSVRCFDRRSQLAFGAIAAAIAWKLRRQNDINYAWEKQWPVKSRAAGRRRAWQWALVVLLM